MGERRPFEDLELGEAWTAGTASFTAESITAFAEQFDPQPFHLDAAAGDRHFDGLIASGWHTASACMRPLAEAVLADIAIIAALGIDGLRWLEPVRPGDELTVEIEIVELEKWDDRRGRVTFRVDATNAAGELVHTRRDNVLVERA